MAMLPATPCPWRGLAEAGGRLLLFACTSGCKVSSVGGFRTARRFARAFHGDWHFWSHVRSARHQWFRGRRTLLLMLRRRNDRFALSVGRTAPPALAIDPTLVQRSPSCELGPSCRSCLRRCGKHRGPIPGSRIGLRRAYGSLYGRAFNCSRFPARTRAFDDHHCQTQGLRERASLARHADPCAKGHAGQEGTGEAERLNQRPSLRP